MESLYKYISPYETINEDEFLQKLANCLTDGGDIDFIFLLDKSERIHGTLLHHSITRGYDKLVEYALSKGANIAIEMDCDYYKLTHKNALDLAVYEYNFKGRYDGYKPSSCRIYEMLKKRNLELYSTFGLTLFHVNCAVELRLWSDEAVRSLRTAAVNTAISTDSPIWPGMAPILIAAKFCNEKCTMRLIDIGADPLTRDLEGNTPLHYLSRSIITYKNDRHERLFALDGKNTFGSHGGQSHFHIACSFFPDTSNIVKRYLEQGISPDLQIMKTDSEENYMVGQTGLHIAADSECPELVRLLLEHGADADKEDEFENATALDYLSVKWYYRSIMNASNAVDCLCMLVEAGANRDHLDTDSSFNDHILSTESNAKREFFSRMKRLFILNENYISKNLKEVCHRWEGWNNVEYASVCSKELDTLSGLGLRRLLDDTITVRSDFKRKFGWLDSVDFESYPIYGSLLKMKFKRKLLEWIRQMRNVRPAIPKVQWLFQNYGRLPHLCADLILWNFSGKELEQFMAQELSA